MKVSRFLWLGSTALCVGAGGVVGFAALQPVTTPEEFRFGEIRLGGLTQSEVRERLQTWWETEKQRTLQPVSTKLEGNPPRMSLEQLGVHPDFEKTLDGVPFQNRFARWFAQPNQNELKIIWTVDKPDCTPLIAFVKQKTSMPKPASVRYESGTIIRHNEITRTTLLTEKVAEEALQAVQNGLDRFEIPLKIAPPKISPEDLAQITDVVSEFTTHFNEGQENRSGNIRIAAEKLNGTIVMPGQTMSYNQVVGPRESDAGYRLAPVYKNGRHEMGFGGGICQTVTTLFNAVLFANLEIVKRQNHSMPVRYVPLGRDATASYGSIDLVFKNTMSTPIAIASEVHNGALTFRILGKKDPGLSVSVEVTNHSSWGQGVKYVNDPTLPPGTTKVIEKGSGGHSCITWRIVKKDGVEIKRERIGSSYYTAFPAIIAKGPDVPGSKEDPEITPPPPSQR